MLCGAAMPCRAVCCACAVQSPERHRLAIAELATAADAKRTYYASLNSTSIDNQRKLETIQKARVVDVCGGGRGEGVCVCKGGGGGGWRHGSTTSVSWRPYTRQVAGHMCACVCEGEGGCRNGWPGW